MLVREFQIGYEKKRLNKSKSKKMLPTAEVVAQENKMNRLAHKSD